MVTKDALETLFRELPPDRAVAIGKQLELTGYRLEAVAIRSKLADYRNRLYRLAQQVA